MYLAHLQLGNFLFQSSDDHKQMVTSFVEWLQLVVAHLDAVERIVLYVTSNLFLYTQIDFNILKPARVEKRWAPWRETLEIYLPEKDDPNTMGDSKGGPDAVGDNAKGTGSLDEGDNLKEITNEELLNFIEERANAHKIYTLQREQFAKIRDLKLSVGSSIPTEMF